ncbi:MAG TPA: serine/threonine-protein kinase, partial [Terriglobales bacterium]|nr:serine/threonine-protein kinase [Terriglobales bacterium]
MAETGSRRPDGNAPESGGNASTRLGSEPGAPSSPPQDSDSPTLIDIPPSHSAPDMPTMVDLAPSSASRPPNSEFQPTAFILHVGAVLAQRYEIQQILGEGGMGAVYKARDRELNRIVALKVIRPEFAGNESIIQRFKQELILARQVTHKNVIRIYDMGEAEGMKFITMEYVEGEDLRALIRQHGKLPPEQAVEIMQQVCRALEAAHSEGVIHRDLKPQNVMQDKQGRILVMDFGLARSLDADGMTQTGALIGTMEYMSPEQAMGNDLDQRSDLFTLGLIFYELLTGNLPFKADTALASLLRRTRERAVPISQVNREVPQDLSNVVSKCLERDPKQRYQNVQEILDDLDRWKKKKRVSVSSAGMMMSRLRELEWTKAALAGLVLLIVVAGTWYFTRSRTKPQATVAPRSVLVADFQNKTGDTLFDGTLEPMVNVALEGASFINAYNRGSARRQAGKLPTPSDKLDDNTARLVAVSQGLSAIVTGSLDKAGSGYKLSLSAIDAVTGKVLGRAEGTAENKDQVLLEVPKIAAPIRKAL